MPAGRDPDSNFNRDLFKRQLMATLMGVRDAEHDMDRACSTVAALLLVRWVEFLAARQANNRVSWEEITKDYLSFDKHVRHISSHAGKYSDEDPVYRPGWWGPVVGPLAGAGDELLYDLGLIDRQLGWDEEKAKSMEGLAPKNLSTPIFPSLDGTLPELLARKKLLDFFEVLLDAGEAVAPLGQYRTPASINELLVEIAAPVAGEKVYDPCFGSGSLLSTAADYVRRHAEGGLKEAKNPEPWIFGGEINEDVFVVGLTRLVLSGVESPQLVAGDSLARPGEAEYDLVLANPPWGRRYGGAVDHFEVPTKDTLGLFIQQIRSHLKPGGRAVTVVPNSFLWRKDLTLIRKLLMREDTIRSVISLPGKCFMPYSSLDASVLSFRRGGVTRRFCMMDGLSYFEDVQANIERITAGSQRVIKGKAPVLSPIMREKLVDDLKLPPEGNCWEVDSASLEPLEYDLTPIRRDKDSLLEILKEIDPGMKIHRLGDHYEIFSGQHVSSSDLYDTAKGHIEKLADDVSKLKTTLQQIDFEEMYRNDFISECEHRCEQAKEKLNKIDELFGTLGFEEALLQLKVRHKVLHGEYLNTYSQKKSKAKLVEETQKQISDAAELGAEIQELEKNISANKASLADCKKKGQDVKHSVAVLEGELLELGVGEELVPFIRIRDLANGEVQRATAWLRPAAVANLDDVRKLQEGDRLLSKSSGDFVFHYIPENQIDCRHEAIGAIASNELIVVRSRKAEPGPNVGFTGYFGSNYVRQWLQANSRGGKHLSKALLADLPIPDFRGEFTFLGPGEKRPSGVDSLDWIAELSGREKDPYAEALREIAVEYKKKYDLILKKKNLTIVLLIEFLRDLGNEFYEGHLGRGFDSPAEKELLVWRNYFFRVAESYKDLLEIPQGPELYAFLQNAVKNLHEAKNEIAGDHGPGSFKLIRHSNDAALLTDVAIEASEWVMKVLAYQAELSFRTATRDLRSGTQEEIQVVVKNKGLFPLRDVRICTTPDWSGGDVREIYLRAGESFQIQLKGVVPKAAGPFVLKLVWVVTTVDGLDIDEEFELAFNVVEAGSSLPKEIPDLGDSPYIVGDPVTPDREDVFKGRDEILDDIRSQVTKSGNVILLEGNRRSGKSTILKHLEGEGRVKGWLGIYFSLQGVEGVADKEGIPTAGIFRAMAVEIAKGIQALGEGVVLPDGSELSPDKKLGIAKACRRGIDERHALSDFREYLGVILEKLAERDRGLLLLFDEFDALQAGIDNGVTSPMVPENIRELVQNNPRFSAVLTGSKRLKRMREQYWSALFGLGHRFGVTALPEIAARELIVDPVQGRLLFEDDAVDEIIRLTARQPFLIQHMCARIFGLAKKDNLGSVGREIVDKAAAAFIEDNEHFQELWDFAEYARRRFLLALCQRESESPEPFRIGVIQEKLAGHGIEVRDKTLIADLEHLIELELLELGDDSMGSQYYAIAVPLMGLWIETHDFEALRIEAMLRPEEGDE